MTANVESPLVKSMKDLVNSKYSLGIERGTAIETVFLEAATQGSAEYNIIKNNHVVHSSENQVHTIEKMANNATSMLSVECKQHLFTANE